MTDNTPTYPQRRSIRLIEYDYSTEGLYFITICSHRQICIFGQINSDSEMILNDAGKLVEQTWYDLPNHIPNIQLDAWCVMPNHVHGIIVIDNVGAGSKPAHKLDKKRTGLEPAPITLSEIVRQLKTFSSRKINKLNGSVGNSVWQRNYYEHIIRNNTSYMNIAQYINTNPMNWETDENYKIN